jgi:UDP-N-acetylglucosamine:LPS N-acetylglucosamine transferase
MALVNKQAALLVSNDKVMDELLPQLKRLINSPEVQMKMKKNLQTLAIKDATERIVNKIIEQVQ